MKDSDIENLPSFRHLVEMRSKLVWSLTTLLLIVLAGNIFLMSIGGGIGASQIIKGSPITLILVYSIFVIFFGAFCCIFYVWWANKYLDQVREEVKSDIKKSRGSST